MSKKVEEVVQKVSSWYVGDDCAQLMIPYQDAITILNRNGIIYHHTEGSEVLVNEYINDERRKQFPYHSLPIHYSKHIDGKYQYTNQLFNFEEPYIRINDGGVIESFVVKDKSEALVVSKIMPVVKETSFKTREEIESMLNPQTEDNEKSYYINLDGTIMPNNEFGIISEEDIFNYIKGQISKNIEDFKEFATNNPGSFVSRYLRKNQMFLKFMEKNIDKLDLNDYQLNIPLNDGESILLVKTNGVDISIQGLDIYFISPNYYRVDTYDMPITRYTLEQLRGLMPKIAKVKEPKISLKLNPGITRDDLKREKELILQRKKH